MATKLNVAIHGAAGRMGQRLVAIGAQDPEIRLTAAVEGAGHPKLGEDAGVLAGVGPLGLPLTTDWPDDVDVIIDFSVPGAALALLQKAVDRKKPVVLATTGFEAGEKAAIQTASHQIPVLWSPSMSLTVNLVMKLAAITGQVLKSHPGGTDVEIIERHHRLKEDAPSGTALKFGEIIAAAMGQTSHVHGREGRPGKRPRNEIGYHAVRIGDNPGEHTLIFGVPGETIELTVRASNRDCYAHGAFAAAKFLAGKGAGMYSMADVLGFTS